MFNIVQNPKPDKCAARRCKGGVHATLPEQDHIKLCVRHYAEWVDGGSPELGVSKEPAPVTELVPANIEPEKREELAQAEQAKAWVLTLPVETQEQIDFVSQVQAQCKDRAKALETERTAITKPINEALKRVNGLFKPLIATYEACARGANGRLLEAQRLAKEIQRQALQEVEAQGGHADETTLLAVHDAPQVEIPAGVGREIWDVECTDEAACPREMLSFDRKKALEIRKYCETNGIDVAQIPGVRFFKKLTGV